MLAMVLGTSALATVIWIILKIRATRKIDVMSFVMNLMGKTRFLVFMTKLGITDRMRPKSATKIVTRNNFVFTTSSAFLNRAIFEYVWIFEVRDDDVFVATYPKAGTTWVQEIAWLICNNADTDEAKKTYLTRRSPFLECIDLGDTLGIQSLEKWPVDKPRIIKTHQPFELLPDGVSARKKGKLVYVARNPKDLCVSYYHFHRMVPELPYVASWNAFLSNFIEGNVPWGDWFTHTLKYWKEYNKNQDQIYFVTYEALKKDLAKEVKSLVSFLGKDLTEEQISAIVKHCTFDSMRKSKSSNYEYLEEKEGFNFSKAKFMRKGQVGDWKNYFTINQSEAFDKLYEERMNGSGLNMLFKV